MNTLPAGTYYIGDLCYILQDDFWDDVCELYFDKNPNQTVFEYKLAEPYLKDRQVIPFAMMRTRWGDGTYPDLNGNWFDVDSGTIGCIEVNDYESLTGSCTLDVNSLFTFDKEFEVYYENGYLRFGHIEINTSGDHVYDYEEDDYEERVYTSVF